MFRTVLALVCAAIALPAQTAPPTPAIDGQTFAATMSFEAEHVNGSPKDWRGGPPATIAVDDKIVHGGRWSVRIDRTAASEKPPFSTVTRSLPVTFGGKQIEFRGFIRTENVSDFVGLWLREDGPTPSLEFDNMQRRQVKGTTDWTEYSIVLPIHPEATQVYFGFLVGGTGRAWADDLQLLVDGKPVWEAPPVKRTETVLQTDKEFDGGSRITLKELTSIQISNLQILGKVWGFLKYHHPSVTAGKVHWDYELFRVLPNVLAASNSSTASAVVEKWIQKLGNVPACKSCAKLDETKIHLHPRIEWIGNADLLGESLSRRLQEIHRNRSAEPKQFYVALNTNVGNPNFDRELGYAQMKAPDAGFQLLALFRMWNIIEYWFPYRDVLNEDWDAVLKDFIPRIGLAQELPVYQRELIALIAKVHDTHANLWSSLYIRPPNGSCHAPLDARFIGNSAVVAAYSHPEAGPATTVKIGDVIEAIDGVPVKTLIEQWAPYYAASNEPTQLRDIARMLTRGECGQTTLRIRRGAGASDVKVTRLPVASLKIGTTHDLPGDTFRKLSNEVAYLKLSSAKATEASKYVNDAAGTKGLIIDIRNYPSEFMVFALGQLLIDKPVPFVTFTGGDVVNPGAFHWGPAVELTPQQPHYGGKVVILIDEVSQSQAEYTTMAFRASPRATVVGSTTAGADGNVSAIPLPGGLRSMISGIGVFYPDKRPTQRIGIVPDIEARPTIDGLRAGRDEVLERALRVILGTEASDDAIEAMARPR